MKHLCVVAVTLFTAWAATSLAADEPSNEAKPIPATRPELKQALESLKTRQPRLPRRTTAEGETSAVYGRTPDDLLPPTWGGGGGLKIFFGSAQTRRDQDPAKLDGLFTDTCFWVVSRGNNCHYCLGHQELKLRFAGLNDDTIAALDSDWTRFDPRQQAAFAFARKLTLEPELVGDADITALKAVFSNAEIVELAFTIALFNAANRWTDGMGLPQERHFGDGGESMFTTPTSELYQHTQSIVTASTRKPRPALPTFGQIESGIAGTRVRTSRVTLPTAETARQELADVIGDRTLYEWERALALLPVHGKALVKTWNTILSDDNLTPRLKAELAFITAVNNRALYAAAHAVHRLKSLGASSQDLTSLLGEHERRMGGAAAAYRLAVKSTTDPQLIADADISRVRDHFSDAHTAQIMQVICMSNLFDRFTESLGLPVEKHIHP